MLERAARVYDCWCMRSILAGQLDFARQSTMTVCICMTIIGQECKAPCADITFSCPVRCVSSQVTKFSHLLIALKVAGVQMSATILPSVRL